MHLRVASHSWTSGDLRLSLQDICYWFRVQGLGFCFLECYWSWNANSGDMGALVDGDTWTAIQWQKIAWIQSLEPGRNPCRTIQDACASHD